MGQDVYTEQRSGEGGVNTGSVGSDLAGFNDLSTGLLERPLDIAVRAVEPIEILPLQPAETSVLNDVLIRGFDIAGSLIMLLLATPVMVVAAILVKGSSAGPVLYRQRRVGKNGKIFKLYKFRTMVHNAEKHTGPVWAARDDGRVTPIGRVLRRTRLDELPQLFNVLRGDMSLVGPRPERPYFVRRHRVLQGVRLMVKPGITGLAQVRAPYDLKPERKLKYDFLYIQKRSFLLNVYIMLMTVPVVLLRKGW
jgi:lipopolysaccharide/colanic/teichoic acid biosynthesis glycosyltransferase